MYSVDVPDSIYELQFCKSNYTSSIHYEFSGNFWMLNTKIHLFVMLDDHYVFKAVVLYCFLFIYYLFYKEFPFKLVESMDSSR